MINLDKMSVEHERLFPLATLEGQVLKLEEEITELENAKDVPQKIKELADICIVCIGIYRWCPKTAKNIIAGFIYETGLNPDEEVNRKWQINLSRTWEYQNGKYHHVGKDGNE